MSELLQALSRLAGNRHSDGVSSLVSSQDRTTIINGCHDLMLSARALTSPQLHQHGGDDATVERVAKALALDMYPDTRWPRDEEDADYGVGDRDGRHPISWHFANKCRSQARAARAALAQQPLSVPLLSYRLLTDRDIIQRGDQPLNDDCVTWCELSGWEVGMRYSYGILKPVRRIVSTPLVGGMPE